MSNLPAHCVFAVFGLWLATAAWSSEIVATDDRGRELTLPFPARTVVTLAPSIAELVHAAGAGARLVGVARYSDYPPEVKKVAQIGDSSRVDLERVLSLKPDLIVGWKTGNQAADIERLEQLGFRVFVIEPDTLAAIPRLLRMLGRLAGTETAASRAAQAFEDGVHALRARYGTRPAVRVFYEIWHMPLLTVNGSHMINDVIHLCGGSNIFAAVPALTPLVSLESVIAAHPQVVLGGSSATTPPEFAAQWQRYENFSGLRNVKAMYVDPDHIQRQTPRILQGARTVCEHLESVRANRRP